MKKLACQVREGDVVNLQGDLFADPEGDNAYFECEYVAVSFVERENNATVLIGIDGFDWIGFPKNHLIEVVGHIEE